MNEKRILFYFSVCTAMVTLIIFIFIFMLLLFIPSVSIVLNESNAFIVIVELLICIISLFGLILLCVRLVNDGK